MSFGDFGDAQGESRLSRCESRLSRLARRFAPITGDPYNNLFQLDKWIPAFERVKKSKLQPSVRLRSVIPAKAGIHFSRWNKTLAWVPAFAGTTLRPGFNRFADFFTRSFAGMTLRKGGKRPRTPQRKYPGNQVPEKPKAYPESVHKLRPVHLAIPDSRTRLPG